MKHTFILILLQSLDETIAAKVIKPIPFSFARNTTKLTSLNLQNINSFARIDFQVGNDDLGL